MIFYVTEDRGFGIYVCSWFWLFMRRGEGSEGGESGEEVRK